MIIAGNNTHIARPIHYYSRFQAIFTDTEGGDPQGVSGYEGLDQKRTADIPVISNSNYYNRELQFPKGVDLVKPDFG